MTPAHGIALGLGGLLLLFGTLMLVRPAWFRERLDLFPRSVWPARILLALAVVWWGLLIHISVLPFLNQFKPLILLGLPVFYLLLVIYLDELLAVRALGALLVLGANPVLIHVRWEDTPFRLLFVVVAYLMAVKGMVLVCAPYLFRIGCGRSLRGPRAVRTWGAAAAVLGAVMAVGGLILFA